MSSRREIRLFEAEVCQNVYMFAEEHKNERIQRGEDERRKRQKTARGGRVVWPVVAVTNRRANTSRRKTHKAEKE